MPLAFSRWTWLQWHMRDQGTRQDRPGFVKAYNAGLGVITLRHQDASVPSENRFVGLNAKDTTVVPGRGVHLYRSPSLNAWVVVKRMTPEEVANVIGDEDRS